MAHMQHKHSSLALTNSPQILKCVLKSSKDNKNPSGVFSFPKFFHEPQHSQAPKACVFRTQFKEHSLMICCIEGTELRCVGFKGKM